MTVAPMVLSLYPALSPDSIWQRIALDTDFEMLCPARSVARAAANVGQTVFRYLFTHSAEDAGALYDSVHPVGVLGAFHTAELPYLFSSLGRLTPFETSNRANAAELALSDTMVGYWTQFAATRNPNGPGLPTWAPYTWSSSSDPFQQLDDAVRPSDQYQIAQCDYFAQWY
jgi:para-nitrobenzyl esterase